MALCTILYFACKKESSNTADESHFVKDLHAKVDLWLEEQKPKSRPNQAATVDLLKSNLDLAKLRAEIFF